MALSWSGRRKTLYSGVAAIVVLVLLVVVYETFFTAAPTCFDGKQDGNETGVDCGGSCALICSNAASAPVVLWSRTFAVNPGIYTAAAYVQNNNAGAGARAVKYSFQLFDAGNSLIIERDGITDLPPVQTIPIIETGINTGTRAAARAIFAFTDLPVWQKIPATALVPLEVAQQNLSADGSRLSAQVVNDGLVDAHNVTIAAVLFDAQGVARAASKSLLQTVPHGSSVPVVFTWPAGVPNIVRAEITVLPSF